MGETANGLPYPADSDVPNGPAQIKALAEAIDQVPTALIADKAVTEAKINDAAVTSRKLKPTTGIVGATEKLVLTSSYQNVPGALLEITPAVASVLLITVIGEVYSNTAAGECDVTVKLDANAEEARTAHTSQGGFWTPSQVYRLSLTAAAHTIQLRAKKEGAEGIAEVTQKGTCFIYQLVAS